MQKWVVGSICFRARDGKDDDNILGNDPGRAKNDKTGKSHVMGYPGYRVTRMLEDGSEGRKLRRRSYVDARRPCSLQVVQRHVERTPPRTSHSLYKSDAGHNTDAVNGISRYCGIDASGTVRDEFCKCRSERIFPAASETSPGSAWEALRQDCPPARTWLGNGRQPPASSRRSLRRRRIPKIA